MAGYEDFAHSYDCLIEDFDYNELFTYYSEILRENNACSGTLLDLACGTGTLTVKFSESGYNVIGLDASCEMLSEAQQKAAASGKDILLVCQDMREMDLACGIDACVCSLDGINHLTQKCDVQRTFDRIAHFMNKSGVFVFDANTLYKHRYMLADNTFVYDVEDAYCVWTNELDAETDTVEMTLDIFQLNDNGSYSRSCECFCERAYSVDFLRKALRSAGFEVRNVFDWLTKDSVKNNSEKAVFVCIK